MILNGVSYARLEDLEITHDEQAAGESAFFRDGIQAYDQSMRHVVFRNLYIHHLDEFGLNLQDVEDLRVMDCQIEYCGFGAIGGPAGTEGGWRQVRIDGCRFAFSGHYYQGGDGTNRPYDRPDGFGIEASAGPVEIVDTRSEHNYGDGLDSKAFNTLIQRCIVANNSCDGVKLWGAGSRVENTLIYGRGDGNPEPSPWSAIVIHSQATNAAFSIVNVTVDDFLGGNYLVHAQYDDAVPVRVTIRDSIFRATGAGSSLWFRDCITLTAENNVFYAPSTDAVVIHGPTEYTANDLASLGTGNRYGDPRFVAPGWGVVGDYHLQADSPAIGTAERIYFLPTDLEGRLRDAEPDVGAYEFGSEVPTARLDILGGAGTLLIQWPDPSPCFRLQSCLSLDGPWEAVLDAPSVSNQVLRVSVPATGRSRFFRLRKE